MDMTAKFVEIKQGNLLIVSYIVNKLKQDSTLEDMEKILNYYTKLLKKNV